MSYPTDAEVAAYAATDVSPALAAVRLAVIAEFERRAGWAYFVAQAGTRYFSCTGEADLWLDCGLVSITSVAVDGVAQTENADYEAWPYNGSPKKKLRFRSVPYADPRGIVVTGEWGFASSCPPDVRLAIMDACRNALGDASGGGAARVTQGPVTVDYGTGGETLERVLYRTPSFSAAIARYRFRTL